MLVLSLDTTTPKASCAIARDGVVINEEPIEASRQLALQLPGALQRQLTRRLDRLLVDDDPVAGDRAARLRRRRVEGKDKHRSGHEETVNFASSASFVVFNYFVF